MVLTSPKRMTSHLITTCKSLLQWASVHSFSAASGKLCEWLLVCLH